MSDINKNKNNIVLIDSSSYAFYRVTATIAWFKKSRKDEKIDISNETLLGYIESQYFSHLEKFSKKVGISVGEMYLIRDCNIHTIWRKKVYSQYKEKRGEKKSIYGQYIKYLNEKVKDKFKSVIRVDSAEADDIIATYVRENRDKNNIFIVGNDSDYHQLHTYSNVTIFCPKGWEKVVRNIDPHRQLFIKVLTGDSTDEIPPCFKGCGVKTSEKLIDNYSNIHCYLFNNRYYYTYLRNRELIDFNYIPLSLRVKILKSFEIKCNNPIQLGLCCINTELRKHDIFCSRKPILRTIEKKGVDYLVEECKKNCKDLIEMIEWNSKNNIHVLRISSGLFPHYSNPKLDSKYSLDPFQEFLDKAGKLARKYSQRLTFHPGQYNVIASPNIEFWEKTQSELEMHAEILDRLGCGIDSVMVIHGGGLYGDKEKTKKRWIERYKQLSDRIRKRLVLENCEKCFSIDDCLDISRECGVPVVFDTHHYDCYMKLHPDEIYLEASEYIEDILKSWLDRGIKPKFHISEQCEGGKTGKHSDLIEEIPNYLLEIPEKYGIDIDIMVEAKLKEQAIFKLYKKYSELE